MTRGAIAAALCALLVPAPAPAQCVIDATSGVAFGGYDPLAAAPTDSSGSVTVHCLVSILITIDLGTGGSGSYAARSLKSGTEVLSYNLYLDAARQTVWGNAAGNGTVHYGPTLGLLAAIAIPIYARIAARQDVAVGNYTDTIVVTLNY